MIIPKKVKAKPPKDFGSSEAWFEYFYSRTCCDVNVDFSSDDPKHIRALAKWLEKGAKFLDKCHDP